MCVHGCDCRLSRTGKNGLQLHCIILGGSPGFTCRTKVSLSEGRESDHHMSNTLPLLLHTILLYFESELWKHNDKHDLPFNNPLPTHRRTNAQSEPQGEQTHTQKWLCFGKERWMNNVQLGPATVSKQKLSILHRKILLLWYRLMKVKMCKRFLILKKTKPREH